MHSLSKARGLRIGLAVLGAALCATATAAGSSASAVTTTADWEEAQVVDTQAGIEAPLALFTTDAGRTAVVYGVGGTTWASSRPAGGSQSWTPPEQLEGAPDDVIASPVASSSGGGAVVFLKTGDLTPEVVYASMSPQGSWTEAAPFPFESTFVPRVALVRPGSGIVAVGSGRRGGPVRAAVKPPGERWQLSPKLPLEGHKLVRGAWYDASGRAHVLVASAQDGAVRRREMFSVILESGAGEPRWGKVHLVPRGTDGKGVRNFHDVNLVSNAAGAITLTWGETRTQGSYGYYVRHRDPVSGWSTARRLPVPMTDIETTLADDGTTRIFYIDWRPDTPDSSEGSYELTTRVLSAEGSLSEEEVLGAHGHVLNTWFDAARGAAGGMLTRWTVQTEGPDSTIDQRVFRCLAGTSCVEVSSNIALMDALLALAPNGSGFAAGTGIGTFGCPTGALCSRRLPPAADPS